MRLKLWICAFIPGDVPGYTRTIPTGPHVGKTAIPMPALARLHPLNLTKDWDAGYLTDQRGFEAASDRSVRLRTVSEIELTPILAGYLGLLVHAAHETSGTVELNMASGQVTCSQSADTSACSAELTLVAGLGAPSVMHLRVVGQASDPCVAGAADIDYEGSFKIEAGPGVQVKVSFNGRIDPFPAYECYAELNGVTKELWRFSPAVGADVLNLPGRANTPVFGSANFA